ncbi:MAG: hypothetical protein Roseis2KO_02920 [Roseivirga sp.]
MDDIVAEFSAGGGWSLASIGGQPPLTPPRRRGIVPELLREIATVAARLSSVSFLAMTFLFVIASYLRSAAI